MNRILDALTEEAMLDIVREIADREGVSPLELPPLYDALDEAPNESVSDSDPIQFPYHGYQVTVQEERAITIQELTDKGPEVHA